MTTTTATTIVKTSDLRVGDLVHTHGMRVRLDAEPKTRDDAYGTVYSFRGLVENLDDVLAEGFIPRSFLCDDEWVDGEGWTYRLTGRWTIQGNDNACWSTERAAV